MNRLSGEQEEPRRPARRRVPALALLGSAGLVAVAAQAPPPAAEEPAIAPQPAVVVSLPHPELLKEIARPAEHRADPVAQPSTLVQDIAAVTAGPRTLRGGLGPIGPISGPLTAHLTDDGVVWGPQWVRGALPAPGRGAPARSAELETGEEPRSDGSSEIPDARKITLSRLANPAPEVRTVEPRKNSAVSPESPLWLRMSVGVPAKGYRAGETVAVRLSAPADCYAAVFRVDAAGKPSTVFRAPAPSRRFAFVMTAGPVAGPEYLVAVASAHPLDGPDAAAALRASGVRFASVTTAAESPTGPSEAWSLAVEHAAALGGSARKWQRFEWAVAAAQFGTRAPVTVAARRASPDKPAAAKPTVKTTGPDESILPTGAATTPDTKPPAAVQPASSPDPKPADPKPAESGAVEGTQKAPAAGGND